MKQTIYDEKTGLWYELRGEYYLPCVTAPEGTDGPVGIWGQRHLRYLKQYKKSAYPNLKDLFSESDYRILNTMVSLTEIGYLRLQDIQIEEVESILEYCFPNDSEGRLFQRFRIISKVIDRAIELDYCTVNPLAQAILDVKKRDKLFSQIRKALTKKHFSVVDLFAHMSQALDCRSFLSTTPITFVD